jgi:hypothetical protein
MLERITGLVNQVLAGVPGATPVTGQDVIDLIGERSGCECVWGVQ